MSAAGFVIARRVSDEVIESRDEAPDGFAALAMTGATLA
jgi:hypothetical protein